MRQARKQSTRAPEPPDIVTLRLRGTFKLNREPQARIDGWDVFYLNAKNIDWADSCNAARAQVFANISIPAVDHKFNEIMNERWKRKVRS